MQTGINNVFTLTQNGYTIEVTVAETYDIVKNISDVSVGVRAKSAYKNGIIYPSGSIKIDGESLVTMNAAVSTHNIPITSINTWYNVVRSSNNYTDSPWTKAGITHNTDGSKTVKLDLEIRGFDAGGYRSFTVSDSRTITLTHIPRASTIGASDANIGAISTLSVVRRSTNYSHTIAYKFGNLSGYINEEGAISAKAVKIKAASIPFLIPESFYAQMPNSSTGVCVLTITTYSGTTQIGDQQTAKFTVTAARSACDPTVRGTVADVNPVTLALTGNENVLVRYASDALCVITAEAKNSATIVEKTIGEEKVKENTITIPGIPTGSVAFGCTDSRGYSALATVEKTLIPYIRLTGNLAVKRTDPTSGKADLTITGKVFWGSFGATDNDLTVTCSINNGEPITLDYTVEGDDYTVTAELTGLAYQKTHSVVVTVSDKLETIQKTAKVGKGIPVFDWGEEDFQFHVPVYINGIDVAAVASNANTVAGNAKTAADDAKTAAEAAKKVADEAAPKSALTPFASCVNLYSGNLSSGSITFDGSAYRLLVVVGITAAGGSMTSVTIPRETITAEDADWMLAGSNYYVSFYLRYSGDTVTLTHKNSSGSGGCITAVYGVA